jgi:hypothetical protein
MTTFIGIWLAVSMTFGALGATFSRRGGSWLVCALMITGWVMFGGLASFALIWFSRQGMV